jgi:hypothetical protein
MVATSPLIFKPSLFHRIFAVLLCVGSWIVGIRGLAILVKYTPKLMINMQIAKSVGESTFLPWIYIVALVVSFLIGILLLAVSILGYILIEGTNIIVDKIGITVTYELLPRRLATYFGAGYLPWNKVVRLEKHGIFFVLYSDRSNINDNGTISGYDLKPSVKFIIVNELERLVLTVFEYSRNITSL